MTPAELGAVRNTRLFEIFNGHPEINMFGGGGVPGLEEAWDSILTSGTLLYGIAVDDAHVFKQPGNPNVAGPGRGWVMVRAERLDTSLIMQALDRGDFYASTGVELADYVVTVAQHDRDDQAHDVFQVPHPVHRPRRDDAQRIGGHTATYEFTGREGYVRAKVLESNGRVAWGQPVIE